ncbi:hypothetical protein EON65_06120 [archaeon]|nr:MAG: hypothetical protein EON65_06120 [archaeon]
MKSVVLPCDEGKECVHRFFDSSPVSSDNKHVVYTQFPKVKQSPADIVLFSMDGNTSVFIGQTFAWGSQVGAQAQWTSPTKVVYNSMESPNSTVYGLEYDIKLGKARKLECPVYHVSQDGQYAVAPNLYKMKHTQGGYGIDTWSSHIENYDHHQDGVFVTDMKTGKCKLLYSIHNITSSINLHPRHNKFYGFHTKWSSDGQFIMFVLRTIEKSFSRVHSSSIRCRVNHLVVLAARHHEIKYVMSWASRPFSHYTQNPRSRANIVLIDGNHPNWVPNSHKISMNMDVSSLDGYKGEGNQKSKWATVVIDTDGLPCNKPLLFHAQFNLTKYVAHANTPQQDSSPVCLPSSLVPVQIAWEYGFGHPSFHADGRHILTDIYEKEVSEYVGVNSSAIGMPILLVDTQKHTTSTLVELPVSKTALKTATLFNSIKNTVMGGKEDRSWRWDMHPSWSPDYTFIAYNVLDPVTELRRVAVSAVTLSP